MIYGTRAHRQIYAFIYRQISKNNYILSVGVLYSASVQLPDLSYQCLVKTYSRTIANAAI